ncbi:DEAD/DEAH box helicase [Oligella urethralis]|uniref:SNF2-related protein n=1 Tax=Oligella urethralis TaxID=90245 RepID=UPI000661603E|nr:DEAD/DEAH box helicase [Oligella urethralis]
MNQEVTSVALENYKMLVNFDNHYKNYMANQTTVETVVSPTPYEVVKENFQLPFELYKFQEDTVNKLALLPHAGYYLDVGAGKTATSIASFLYKLAVGAVDKLVVIMPPVLIDGWYKTFETYPDLKGKVTIYRGTPTQRKKINLGSTLITLVGIQIFKADFERFDKVFGDKTAVIFDEAAAIKNISSQNYRYFREFALGKSTMLLTGTPLSKPTDGYAYMTFTAPGLYRNYSVFCGRYEGSRDFFGNVVSWRNLEELNEALQINSVRILKQDVLHELPEVTYTPLYYELNKQHYTLYTKLALEEMLVLEDGGKIDATTASALYHKLGQIICNYDYFSGKENAKSTCYELLDQVLSEIGDEKLVIFSNYRLTNRSLERHLQRHNVVTAFGDNSVAVNNKNIQTFIDDPECKILIGQPSSIGVGVNGLQDVCRNILFLEVPTLTLFHQSVARLHRTGQKQGVNVRIAVALNTLQVRQTENLINNDTLVNKVIRNAEDLKDALFGK